jgi:hypothetical protein
MKLIEDNFTNTAMSRQLKHYHRRAATGQCVTCRKSRGKSPTLECRKCTKLRSERRKKAREAKKRQEAKRATKSHSK